MSIENLKEQRERLAGLIRKAKRARDSRIKVNLGILFTEMLKQDEGLRARARDAARRMFTRDVLVADFALNEERTWFDRVGDAPEEVEEIVARSVAKKVPAPSPLPAPKVAPLPALNGAGTRKHDAGEHRAEGVQAVAGGAS